MRALFFTDIFEERKSPATFATIFLGFNAVIITLIVYPITSGYNPILKYPLIAMILFVVDIVIELGLLIFGNRIFYKTDRSHSDTYAKTTGDPTGGCKEDVVELF